MICRLCLTFIAAYSLSIVACVLGAENAQSPNLIISPHSDWRYFASKGTPSEEWLKPEFDDSSWDSGPAGFGYGDNDDRTQLEAMQGAFTRVKIRKRVVFDASKKHTDLFLYVNYDDGFRFYINGKCVVSANVKESADGSLRVRQHEGGKYDEFVIPNGSRLLSPGVNVIAVEGFNVSVDSSDFSLDPFLSTTKVDSRVSVEEYLHDVDVFEQLVKAQSAYLKRTGLDFERELAALRESIDHDTDLLKFTILLRELVMKLGDCHASVTSAAWPFQDRSLPIRLADTREGLAALSLDSDSPIDSNCPIIKSFDGVSIEDWLSECAKFVPNGSQQLVRR